MRYTEIKNFENEEWRPIEGFDGRYYVSNYGRVKSHLRHGYNQIPCEGYEHLLRPMVMKIGYQRVSLWMKGEIVPKYVHRLVAAAFLGELGEGAVVNHKDGCKTNNHVSNLEITTHSGNRSHAVRTGLLHGPCTIYNQGRNVRRFTFVGDAVEALIYAYTCNRQLVNVVNPVGNTVREFCDEVGHFRPLKLHYTHELRPLDNFEQSVNETIFTVPLPYRNIEQGLSQVFSETSLRR